MIVKCPICRKPVEPGPAAPDFPFCSERCRLIDLGNWAAEKYVIPGPASTPVEEEKKHEDE
ncbi:MAG: DNA gyrase inhibitor YacG [Acidobacteria bacterium]|nr:DNA gyrase inhibitor YacG [Acidobacteriota bacterium]